MRDYHSTDVYKRQGMHGTKPSNYGVSECDLLVAFSYTHLYTLNGEITVGEDLLNPQNVTASVTVTVVSSVWERLDAAISSAREKDPEDYTQVSWDAVQKALDAAQAVKNAQQPNDQDAENAATALEQALDALVRDVDKTVLLENLETAEKILENELENHYTAESWKALADVYEEAERVYACLLYTSRCV